MRLINFLSSVSYTYSYLCHLFLVLFKFFLYLLFVLLITNFFNCSILSLFYKRGTQQHSIFKMWAHWIYGAE